MEYKTFKIHKVFSDADFGRVVLEEDLIQPSNSSYNCEFLFSPSGKNIKAVLKAEPGGPHPWQRQFLDQLVHEYPSIESQLFEQLKADFSKIGIELKSENFQQEFLPVFLSLDQKGALDQEWELNFTTVHDPEYLIIGSFRNWNLTGIDFIN